MPTSNERDTCWVDDYFLPSTIRPLSIDTFSGCPINLPSPCIIAYSITIVAIRYGNSRTNLLSIKWQRVQTIGAAPCFVLENQLWTSTFCPCVKKVNIGTDDSGQFKVKLLSSWLTTDEQHDSEGGQQVIRRLETTAHCYGAGFGSLARYNSQCQKYPERTAL